MSTADARVAARAATQYGTFSAIQAVELGLNRRTLRRQVKQNRVIELHPPFAYAMAGSPATWEHSLSAAVMAAGPCAVASHRSAARLWALLPPEDDTVEISVPRSWCHDLRGVVCHRVGDLADNHVSLWRRFPVTKPARTIVDLGAVLPPDEVEDALDRALARRLINVAGVEWMRNQVSRQGRGGAGVIGRILDQRALGAEPPDGLLEPRMARLLTDARLPPAEFQYRIYTADRVFLARVDFAYPDLLLAIEVDGYETHGSPREMARDFVRQNGLVPYRWHVLRFTWTQVVKESRMVAAAISEALAGLQAG